MVRIAGMRRDQGDDEQGRAEADLQVTPAPERAEPRSSPEPAPAPLDRLSRRLVVARAASRSKSRR